MTVLKSDIRTTEDAVGSQVDENKAGNLKVKQAKIAAAILADNDVVEMVKVPVNAVITSVVFAADKLGTTGDLNVGLYPGNIAIAADTDAVDEDCIATAIDVNAAITAPTEIRYEVTAIETIGQKAWELAGLSAEPAYGEFVVACTASEATTAAGDITIKVEYI